MGSKEFVSNAINCGADRPGVPLPNTNGEPAEPAQWIRADRIKDNHTVLFYCRAEIKNAYEMK